MAQLFDLPEPLQARIKGELRPGEQLVWVSQPKPLRFMWLSFALWLFFIPWTAFTLFWIAGAAGFKLPTFDDGINFFPLFGLPFLFIGLAGLSAPIWAYRKAGSTVYAITDLRAITLQGPRSVTVRSLRAAQLGNIERTERADGSGDLVFSIHTDYSSSGDRLETPRGFLAIPDVKQAAQLLENLAATARKV